MVPNRLARQEVQLSIFHRLHGKRLFLLILLLLFLVLLNWVEGLGLLNLIKDRECGWKEYNQGECVCVDYTTCWDSYFTVTARFQLNSNPTHSYKYVTTHV